MANPFGNIAIHLQATGPAAVMIAWILAVTLLGLYGTGYMASAALTVLILAGGVIMRSLAERS